MSIKCLMLETSDKKRFFLPIGCRKTLDEYCRAFGAKTQVVQAELKRKQLIGIPALVLALCDKGHRPDRVEFKAAGKGNAKRAR
jgi:hypothetical protein